MSVNLGAKLLGLLVGRALTPVGFTEIWCEFSGFWCVFPPQRKSSKAKEKKQRRLEERAAMAAVCAKVEAANKVSVENKKKERKTPESMKIPRRPRWLSAALWSLPAPRSPRSLPGVQEVRQERVSADAPGVPEAVPGVPEAVPGVPEAVPGVPRVFEVVPGVPQVVPSAAGLFPASSRWFPVSPRPLLVSPKWFLVFPGPLRPFPVSPGPFPVPLTHFQCPRGCSQYPWRVPGVPEPFLGVTTVSPPACPAA